jgi:predicted HTH domain antitoxin
MNRNRRFYLNLRKPIRFVQLIYYPPPRFRAILFGKDYDFGGGAVKTIQIDLPDETLLSLKETPEHFAQEIKILAAVKLFELGRLSSGRAAQLAGLSRVQFLTILGRYQVSPFALTADDLAQDLDHA